MASSIPIRVNLKAAIEIIVACRQPACTTDIRKKVYVNGKDCYSLIDTLVEKGVLSSEFQDSSVGGAKRVLSLTTKGREILSYWVRISEMIDTNSRINFI
jgi:DNA-binding PadR family transcriptional regulator